MNPESTANSTAFLQASTSASSLSNTAGPLAEMDAITSPESFLITAPNPDACKSWNIAASKLSLNPLAAGSRHCEPLGT